MFTSMLGDLKGYFGKAFVMAVWLPVGVFASALAVVLAPGTALLQAIQSMWNSSNLEKASLLAIEFLLVVTLVAYMLQQLQVPVTQFFEGYWEGWPILNLWGAWKKKSCAKALQTLDERIDYLDEQIPLAEKEGGKRR